jgi:23S rRNA (guanosine2251-2'-O)-methyltransferase
LYGIHACFAALRNKNRIIENVWCSESIVEKLENDGILHNSEFFVKRKYNIADKKTLDRLVNGSHQGIVVKAQNLRSDTIDILKTSKSRIVVVLDHVSDTQNVGSILRLCRVFGVGALVTTMSSTPQENGAIAKMASGAIEVVPRCFVPNLADAIRKLKAYGYWIIGLAESAQTSLKEIDLTGKIAIIVGSEGTGMRHLTKKLCDSLVHIPTDSEFSTLNVTMATAISLYEVFQIGDTRKQSINKVCV